jgi:hypothetical protein
MTRRRLVSSMAAALLAVATMAPLMAQQRERVLLGMMRRDGVILPFAAYDGDWSVPWPVAVRSLELPITLDAVPRKWWGGEMPGAWTLWPSGKQPELRVTPAAPIAIVVGHEKRLGLRTDFVSSEPLVPPYEMPYPKEGVAIGGDAKLEEIAIVSRLSAAWRDLPSTIRSEIDAAEQRAVGRVQSSSQWAHPVPREIRQKVPAALEAWYTSILEQPGFGVSYIEAVKKYPPGANDRGCGLETFVSGWIHSNARDPRLKTDLVARITYCDRAGVIYMLPFGRLRAGNRTHWVFQFSSSEREWYTVVEATPGRTRVVAEYYGGGRQLPF